MCLAEKNPRVSLSDQRCKYLYRLISAADHFSNWAAQFIIDEFLTPNCKHQIDQALLNPNKKMSYD